ncbi:hypothetical protein A9P44_00910 [Paenibacillus polymyxa]|nr:hypothetical protein A9P44_00910 [Paenibacillus polymyxa]
MQPTSLSDTQFIMKVEFTNHWIMTSRQYRAGEKSDLLLVNPYFSINILKYHIMLLQRRQYFYEN